jgi:hypothetical protein
MTLFLWGAFAFGATIAGLFFLRFYSETKDRFFLIFAAAFWVLALDRVALTLITPADENRHYVYLIRLVAFLLIIAGVLDKNRVGRDKA